jgi:hypothetical protein
MIKTRAYANLKALFNNKDTADVRFQFSSGTVLHAHQFILKLNSKVFNDMFTDDTQTIDKVEEAIQVEDNEQAFISLIKSFYTSELEIQEYQCMETLDVAIKYDCTTIRDIMGYIISLLGEWMDNQFSITNTPSTLFYLIYSRAFQRVKVEPLNTQYKLLLDLCKMKLKIVGFSQIIDDCDKMTINEFTGAIEAIFTNQRNITIDSIQHINNYLTNCNEDCQSHDVFELYKTVLHRIVPEDFCDQFTSDVIFSEHILLLNNNDLKDIIKALAQEPYRKEFDQMIDRWVDHSEERIKHYRDMRKHLEIYLPLTLAERNLLYCFEGLDLSPLFHYGANFQLEQIVDLNIIRRSSGIFVCETENNKYIGILNISNSTHTIVFQSSNETGFSICEVRNKRISNSKQMFVEFDLLTVTGDICSTDRPEVIQFLNGKTFNIIRHSTWKKLTE